MPKTGKKAAEPFIVIDKGLRILITPVDGWYAVQGLDVRGLNTQGRTIEEALAMAHDAAEALAEARALMAKTTAKTIKAVPAAVAKRSPRRRQPVGA
jgi:predicted RNase H-like HicB family nuclease